MQEVAERFAEPKELEAEIPKESKAQKTKAQRIAKREKKKKALQILVETRDQVPVKGSDNIHLKPTLKFFQVFVCNSLLQVET